MSKFLTEVEVLKDLLSQSRDMHEMRSRGEAMLHSKIAKLEAENAELTAFRNSYKDTIRRLQDSISAAEAREQKLREALMALLPKVQGEDGCLEDDDLCTIIITFRELVAARRALGGEP